MGDKNLTVVTPNTDNTLGGRSTGSGTDKPLSVASPMEAMNSSMAPSTGGQFNGVDGYGFGAFKRTAGATGPAEKVFENATIGKATIVTPNLSDSDIPRK